MALLVHDHILIPIVLDCLQPHTCPHNVESLGIECPELHREVRRQLCTALGCR